MYPPMNVEIAGEHDSQDDRHPFIYPYYDAQTDEWNSKSWSLHLPESYSYPTDLLCSTPLEKPHPYAHHAHLPQDALGHPPRPESPTTSCNYLYLFDDDTESDSSSTTSPADTVEWLQPDAALPSTYPQEPPSPIDADQWLDVWLGWNPASSDPLNPVVELPELAEEEEADWDEFGDLLSAFPEPPFGTPPQTRSTLNPSTYHPRRGRGSLNPENYSSEIRDCVDSWLTITSDSSGAITLLHSSYAFDSLAAKSRYSTRSSSSSRPTSSFMANYDFNSTSTLRSCPHHIFVDAYDAIASVPDLMREIAHNPSYLPPGVSQFHGHARWLIIREVGHYIRARIRAVEKDWERSMRLRRDLEKQTTGESEKQSKQPPAAGRDWEQRRRKKGRREVSVMWVNPSDDESDTTL